MNWPRAFSASNVKARYRCAPEDFFVEEYLPFVPCAEGEHVYLFIEKRSLNTHDIIQKIANYANVSQSAVGYAGLKDKHAVTRQWFSVHLPGKKDINWSGLSDDNIKILQLSRHAHKLRRGVIAKNHFNIIIRDIESDIEKSVEIIQQVKQRGIPNYFGIQRFGTNGRNLENAVNLFEKKRRMKRISRSMALSAARSYLFNVVLGKRIEAAIWDSAIPGDIMCLEGSRKYFHLQKVDTDIKTRLATFDIHPSGPLWGKGPMPTTTEARALEENALQEEMLFCNGLAEAGLSHERRPLRVKVNELDWTTDKNNRELALSFSLPAGSFATSLLSELGLP